MNNISFTERALQEYLDWQTQDEKTLTQNPSSTEKDYSHVVRMTWKAGTSSEDSERLLEPMN